MWPTVNEIGLQTFTKYILSVIPLDDSQETCCLFLCQNSSSVHFITCAYQHNQLCSIEVYHLSNLLSKVPNVLQFQNNIFKDVTLDLDSTVLFWELKENNLFQIEIQCQNNTFCTSYFEKYVQKKRSWFNKRSQSSIYIPRWMLFNYKQLYPELCLNKNLKKSDLTIWSNKSTSLHFWPDVQWELLVVLNWVLQTHFSLYQKRIEVW